MVEVLVLRFAFFKFQGSTLHGCKQSFGATPSCEKPIIELISRKKTSESAIHGTKVYITKVSLKGLALKRFFDIKK